MTVAPGGRDAAELLAVVTAGLDRAEERPGQRQMTELVAAAIERRRHLVVSAGTGTGKTLAYLVPAIAAGHTTVITTATKALQDQLAGKDLPFLESQLADEGVEFDWAVLKGRSNYVCLQRVRELATVFGGAATDDDARTDSDGDQLQLAGVAESSADLSKRSISELKRLAPWIGTTTTGDLAEVPVSLSSATTAAITVGSDECPGRERCPMGDSCFAEHARTRAQAADVIVVNTYLYGLDVGADGAILPDHDVVIFDEAHGVEDIMSDTVGVQIAPGRFFTVAAIVARFLDDDTIHAALIGCADELRAVLRDHVGRRLPHPYPDDVAACLADARIQLERALNAVTTVDPPGDEPKQRRLRAQLVLGRTIEAIDVATGASTPAAMPERDQIVDFVSGTRDNPRLELAPLDVGPALTAGVWNRRTAILTSATIPASLPARLGLPAERVDSADVGSPFDYETNGLLYCPVAMPDPRAEAYRAAVHDELTALITAAGGRTLALFTSYRAMDEAAEAVADRVGTPILKQRDRSKTALLKEFADDEATSLFATAGFFQGVDVPGTTLSLVVIDRLPFPRPDDPLLSARREQLGARAFDEIDIPRAATMLAQAAGRLIRTADDRGVVAVLDRRLGTARYRWSIVNALPPMRRTRHRADVETFLAAVRS